MVEVKRKQGESAGALARRFSAALQKSGILLRAKEHRFRHGPVSERIKRRRALRKEELKKYYQNLKKLGKT